MNKTHSSAALIGILIFIFLVGAFSYMEYSRHQSLLIQEMTNETERLLYYLQDYIEDKKDHLKIIANLWKGQHSSEQAELFQEVAEETINVFPSYRFIHFIDTDLVIRHSAPQEEAKRVGLIGKDTSQDSENIIMLEKMMETHRPLISPVIWREVSEGYGSHIWVPILEGPELLGIISGDLDLSYIISMKILETDLSHPSINIHISDTNIFGTCERETCPVSVTHKIIDTPWTIGICIERRMSPSVVFFSGVLLSLLVSFSVYKMLIRNRELEQTKDDLEDREENLSVTLRSIGDGMIATDTKGHITRMNPAAEKLTGWKFHEAIDRRIEEVFPIFNAITGEPATNPAQQALEEEKVVGLANDTILMRRDKTQLQIADSAAPIKDNQGRIKGVVLVFSDVTEQYRAQRMIKESEKKYRSLFNEMLDAFALHKIILDENGVPCDYEFVEVNPTFEKITGLSNVVGNKVTEIHPGIKSSSFDWIGEYGKVALKGTALNFEQYFEDAERWYSVRAYSSKKGYFACIFEDITDRKQMEKKIQYQHDFQKIVANISYSFINTPRSWIDEAINNALYQMGTFFNVDRAYLFQFSSDGKSKTNTHEWCREGIESQINLIQKQPVDDFPWIKNAIQTKEYVFIPDVNTIAYEEERKEWQRQGIQSLICIPIKVEKRVVGFIGMDAVTEKKAWNDEELSPLIVISEIMSSVFSKHQMEQKLRKSEEKHRRLFETMAQGVVYHARDGQIISANPAAERILGLSFQEMQGKTSMDPRWQMIKEDSTPVPGEEHPAMIALRTGKKIGPVIRGVYHPDKNTHIWLNIIAIPLYQPEEEEPFQVYATFEDITHRKQLEQELIQRNQEVEQLNQHLNQEIEKAHLIHSNILPKEFPSIQGISFAAFYQPAEKLGGDFYRVIQADNKLVIYLSDISGHGLDGSMINFFVKEAIDSYISLKPDELSPRSILRHLERQFRKEKYPDDLFICIFLAVLDLETMELTYTGAGFQDTPFVRQGNGEQAMLSTKELFINSIFPIDNNSFQERTIALTKGSTIFFNTDGLTEQGESGAFYRDRLPQVFYMNAYLPPDGISQAVLEDFRQFNNGSLQGDDDITFLILKVDTDNTKHQFELKTDFDALEGLRSKAMEILPNVLESEMLINSLYELVANAMEHGNQMDSAKKVIVELIIYDGYMQASAEDEGAGFNWREKIDNPFELEGHNNRGRGIAMTRILCDSLFYNDQGNKVTSVVQLSQGGGPCK